MGKDKHSLKGHSGWIFSVAFSPDGKLIASGSLDDTIKIWNAATGEVKHTLEGHDGGVFSIAFSPDGNLIASGPHDKTIKVWNAATGEVKHTLVGQSVSFDTTGLYLFTDVSAIKLDAIAHISAKGLTQSQAQAQEARQCGYDLSPDKSWITWNGHKALWLPPEYRPSVSAIWCSVPPSTVVRIAIGCSSRRVIIISFSKPPPVLLPSYL
ncbi:hypothetical protein FOVG_18859 [Fusarium oxysporum f. sp. pisi HDV247]|uniref:Uncharacterized protein n=1 Tax=Fusarium oxysporum f. sp. pisi HDV247 TaxID=1080344 RepID=W9NA57_FUSOX|nr:hypothetical protein FOVG_18859 [Fusarium oxysporum f. sp. pisi HDV247]